MEIYKGTATFSGIAIGKILFYYRNEYCVEQNSIKNVREEIEIFQNARRRVLRDLTELYEKNDSVQERQAQILLKQKKLLENASFSRAIESMIATEKVNASYAVATTREEMTTTFRVLEEEIVQEQLNNIREICGRLIDVIGGACRKIHLGEEPVILASESLTPTELLEMEKEQLLAIVTHQGSDVSHASIMAKTMNIPFLVDIPCQYHWNGKMAIVDGHTGTIYLEPDEALLEEYKKKSAAEKKERMELLTLRDKKDITIDGREIKIFANIGNLEDLSSVLYYGAGGIGLLRSEFQYLGRENYPRENELFRVYKKLAETMEGRVAVIRTVDLGADKQSAYMEIPEEGNPIMGNRGIRLCLDRKKMFRAQLRAIYRASAYGNLAIMYPMITSEAEMDEIQEIIAQVKAGLQEKQIPYKDILTGIMVETPAAVMISRELARRVDFLCMGTNDLTQYTLAMDRQNPYLKKKYDDHHPAILRMIRMVVEAGHAEGCQVGICGEIGADTALTEEFLRMGVDMLSVVPSNILRVRRAVREVDLSK